MASGNQGQGRRTNEGRDRNNGGAQPAKEQAAQNPAAGAQIPQGLQQGVEQVAGRLREGYDSAREEVAHRYRRAEGTIARNPAPSILIGFGLGFGLGLAITALMARDEETWADRYLPDSLRDLPDSFNRMRKRVPESVRDAHLADSLHHTFHHLAESIRDLPSAVAKMMPGR